jgi:hypothetical protein
MASPFRTFRKNQKAWMVGLTIMTMFAFVFLGQVAGNRSSSSGEYKDPEVFSWKYGSVHKSEIEQRLTLRRMINQFLAQAALKAEQSPQIIMMLQSNQIFRPVEKEVVDTMLLDKKAQQLGIVVSDRMVNDFIHAVAPGLSGQDLANILRGMSYERAGLGQAQLFDAIRDELAARYVDQTFGQMLGRSNGQYAWFNGDTPADRWEYFSRLNRKVTAEILPVAVEKFVAEIPDPSADELRKFYELYKNDYPDSSRPTPGFKRPFRAQFQYVKADYDKKLKEEMAKVTDEEIAEYYEKNKDDFKKSKLPDLPERPLDVPLPESGKNTTEEKSPDDKSDAKSDAKAGGPTTDGAKSEDKSGAAAKSTSGKSDAKGAAPKSGEPKKSGDTKGNAKKSSLNQPTSLDGEQLAMADDAAVLLAQASSTAPKAAPKSAAKTDAKSDAAKLPKSGDSVEKAKDTSAPKDSEANIGDKQGQTKEQATADAKAADAKPADEKSASTAEPPVEYKPLEDVKETIRQRIADKKVHDKRIAAFSSVKQLMSNYRRDLESYNSKVKQGMSAKKPEAPTPEFLADAKYDAGLDGHTTELVSPSEIDSSELGRSYRGPTSQNYSTTPFLRIAFQEASKNSRGLPLYQVDESQDNDQNEYLWWKIDEKPAEIPKLEDIKDEVVKAWKMIQARKPAKAKAEADAQLANKDRKGLKDVLGDSQGEVTTAGPFSWYSRLPAQLYDPLPRITLTKVSGVEQGGNDFLKAVFALKEGQTGVAVNQPETIYYVVQIESEEPGLDKLHDEFLADMSNPMAAQVYAVVGATENAGQGLAWLNELKDEFGFKLAPGQTLSEATTMTME